MNFKTPELALKGVASLEGELEHSRDRVVVVDNNSGDGSVARLKEGIRQRKWESWAFVVEAESNGGFSAGNNVGMRAVEAKYYLLLNSDAYIREGAVATLVALAEADSGAGVIGPRLEWPDGQVQVSCFRAPSPLSELVSAARTKPVTALLRRFEVPVRVEDLSVRADWVSFACALIRADTVEDVGSLDAGYFMFFEDVDFCCRARAAGWSVWYEPAARAVHLRGGTSQVKAAEASLRRLPRYWYASRARYFRKQYGPFGLWLANLCWYLGRIVSLSRELVGHKQRHVCDAKWRDIWIHDSHPPAR